MSEEPLFEYDESVIGVEEVVGRLRVDADQLARYCEVIGETNPLYTEQQFVPPSLLDRGRMRFSEGPNPNVRFGNNIFQAGSRLDLLAPVRVGDNLTAWAQVKEVYAKTGRSGTMVFRIRRLTFRNDDGDPIAYLDQTTVHRQIGE